MHFSNALGSSLALLSGLVASQITITRTVIVDPIEVTEPSKPSTKPTVKPTTIITFTSLKPTTKPAPTSEVTKTVYITVTTSIKPATTKKPNTTPPAVTVSPDPNSTKCPVPLYYGCYASRSANACTKCVQGAYCKSQNEFYWQCVTTATDDDRR
ncbi:uncharacterized protein RAG0_03587 [Rhynchosporium agropyri]|uniref:CBM1 domain-containing protein n=2 Tax=Rhynchosporium TaxID=38037 RepID=A0A1E1K507_9HELO|nr:uncharacterized protein RAG0_03587 [Rhynchosporium agropyri]CZT07337.1 uncharacterized protein RCO7_07313 [Rhynchosporium commune]